MDTVPPVGAVVDYVNEEDHRTDRLVVVWVNTDARGGDPLLYLAERPIGPLTGDEGKLYHPLNLIYQLHVGRWTGAVSPRDVTDTGERLTVIPFNKTEDYRHWKGCTFDGRNWQRPKAAQ